MFDVDVVQEVSLVDFNRSNSGSALGQTDLSPSLGQTQVEATMGDPGIEPFDLETGQLEVCEGDFEFVEASAFGTSGLGEEG